MFWSVEHQNNDGEKGNWLRKLGMHDATREADTTREANTTIQAGTTIHHNSTIQHNTIKN